MHHPISRQHRQKSAEDAATAIHIAPIFLRSVECQRLIGRASRLPCINVTALLRFTKSGSQSTCVHVIK